MMPPRSLVAPISRVATAANMAPVSMPPRWAHFKPSAACMCRQASTNMRAVLAARRLSSKGQAEADQVLCRAPLIRCDCDCMNGCNDAYSGTVVSGRCGRPLNGSAFITELQAFCDSLTFTT